MAAFRGMQVSPAKHSYASVTDGQTDRRTDGRRTKWSLCVAMLRRRHNKNCTYRVFFFISWKTSLQYHSVLILISHMQGQEIAIMEITGTDVNVDGYHTGGHTTGKGQLGTPYMDTYWQLSCQNYTYNGCNDHNGKELISFLTPDWV